LRAPEVGESRRHWKGGDRATWSYVASGYRFSINVVAIVREVHKRNVLIEVAQRQQGSWVRVLKLVPARKLSPRTTASAELGEVDTGDSAGLDPVAPEVAP